MAAPGRRALARRTLRSRARVCGVWRCRARLRGARFPGAVASATSRRVLRAEALVRHADDRVRSGPSERRLCDSPVRGGTRTRAPRLIFIGRPIRQRRQRPATRSQCLAKHQRCPDVERRVPVGECGRDRSLSRSLAVLVVATVAVFGAGGGRRYISPGSFAFAAAYSSASDGSCSASSDAGEVSDGGSGAAPTPRRSSTWGMNQAARNAMAPIGAAIRNTVWIDSA